MVEAGGGNENICGAENCGEVDDFRMSFYHWSIAAFGFLKLFFSSCLNESPCFSFSFWFLI